MPASAKGGRYHHGDLRAALTEAAIALIAERGVRGFSLAEVSRRLGVSAAAPYRHFADRDDLLAAIAVRSLQVFGDLVAAEAGAALDPPHRLAAMTRAYVRFAAEQRPLFEVLYSYGLDKAKYPQLRSAYEPVDAFLAVVTEICAGDQAAAEALATALEASARGHAVLLLDDETGIEPARVRAAAGRAAAATLALIDGRATLTASLP
jgi:AcrR family transcriptional regulator